MWMQMRIWSRPTPLDHSGPNPQRGLNNKILQWAKRKLHCSPYKGLDSLSPEGPELMTSNSLAQLQQQRNSRESPATLHGHFDLFSELSFGSWSAEPHHSDVSEAKKITPMPGFEPNPLLAGLTCLSLSILFKSWAFLLIYWYLP
jgi:hypothetical protein